MINFHCVAFAVLLLFICAKGEKTENAEACKCITNQLLLDKIENLERLLNSTRPGDCEDIQEYFPNERVGVKTLFLSDLGVQVFCDLEEGDDRMWTVIQKRLDGSEDFFRGWNDYVNGFGNRNSEYWIGLDNIHALTKNGNYELKVSIEDWEGVKKYALYSEFMVGNVTSDYQLTVGGYNGTAGDSLSYHDGQTFSTKDHDVHRTGCPNTFKGGWWYKMCHYVNLNGLYLPKEKGASAKGIEWRGFHGHYSHKKVAMKIRRRI